MTSPEAEDMNMISASVVGLLFEKDMKLNKPQNIVDTASLYGHTLKHCGHCFLIWTCTQTLWAVLHCMDIHSTMGGAV